MMALAVAGLVLPIVVFTLVGSECQNGFLWTIPEHSTSVCCRNVCKDKGIKDLVDDCCFCQTYPVYNPDSIPNLLIEYVNRKGGAVVIHTLTSDTRTSYVVQHNNGYLDGIPSNVCDFPGIVSLDFDNNNIKMVSNITCLTYLDTLSLSNNAIEYLGNRTFIGLSHLRVLRIKGNKLTTLEPGIFSDPSLAILFVDLSENELKTLDVTHIILNKGFCEYDYSSNHLDDVTNDLGFHLRANEKYGAGGFINMQSNNFPSFIDFKKIGIEDLNLLGKVVQYGFDFRGSNITCDGSLVPLLQEVKKYLDKIWRDYYNVTCYQPEELRGKSISKLAKEGKLDLFITVLEKCPLGCRCVSQPSKHRTIVNCSSSGLNDLPPFMPDMDNIELYIKDNSIKRLDKRNYWGQIIKLDISSNALLEIEDGALLTMQNVSFVNISVNPHLSKFPISMRKFDPCQFDTSGLHIQCDCKNTWISEWLNYNTIDRCKETTELICKTFKGNHRAIETTAGYLDCESDRPVSAIMVISIVLVLLIVPTFFLLHFLRYEILIIYRNILRFRSKKCVSPFKKFDVYITCDDSEEKQFYWVYRSFINYLEQSRYKVCFPARDFQFGTTRSEEIIGNINRSRNFLVVLCNNYFNEDNPWSKIEWRHAWKLYRARELQNIIIVNFDHLKLCDIADRRMKAFFRLGIPLDFSNRKHVFMQDVMRLLGERITPRPTGLDNARSKFTFKF